VVHVDGGRGPDADARRLDRVDDVDADVRADMAGHRGIVSRYVGCDDGGDDAAVSGADAGGGIGTACARRVRCVWMY